jgi:hypothetical protein
VREADCAPPVPGSAWRTPGGRTAGVPSRIVKGATPWSDRHGAECFLAVATATPRVGFAGSEGRGPRDKEHNRAQDLTAGFAMLPWGAAPQVKLRNVA